MVAGSIDLVFAHVEYFANITTRQSMRKRATQSHRPIDALRPRQRGCRPSRMAVRKSSTCYRSRAFLLSGVVFVTCNRPIPRQDFSP